MKDRIPRDPGRVLITPESGEAFYATVERADNPLQKGDALNKKNLLPDEVAEKLGLDVAANPVPADAFEHIAAKGLRIGITVHGGTSAPASPKDGDIWVNTSTPISSWAYAFSEPQNPTEGKVWLQASESVALDTFADGNITISPISARQFIGGLWVSKEAKTYTNGEWKDWITLLINGSDECADVTGGWESLAVNIYNGSSARALGVTTGADYIELSGGGGGYGGIFCTANKIRCTGSTTLRISGEIAAYSDHVQIAALSSKTSNGVVAEWVAPGGAIRADPKTYNDEAVLDLPAGEYYIAFSIYSTDNQYVRINKLYMANKAGGSIQPGGGGGGEISAEVIEQAVKNYLEANPIEETDPTVPSWAKASSKPSYTKSEVGLGNVDNVKQYSASNPPPYPVTKVNNKTGAVTLSASDVGARPSTWTPTYSDVGADKSGAATSAVSTHNTNTAAHNDIRLLISGLTTRLDALANSDDTTLDQMAEIVAYIKNNKSLIDSITTDKVNVADIINNLTTNVANKPLSAAQGVALKALIDALGESKLDASRLTDAINTALAQAKASGEFDGEDGKDGKDGLDATPVTPLFANSIEECTDTSKFYVLPDGFIYAYLPSAGPSYTNLAGTITYDKRLSSSGKVSSSAMAGACYTDFIPVKKGQIVRIKGLDIFTSFTSSSFPYVCFYTGASENNVVPATPYCVPKELQNEMQGVAGSVNGGVVTWTAFVIGGATQHSLASSITHIRISGSYLDDQEIIVTVDEEITEGGGGGYAWQSTGHAFVPADYEAEILALQKNKADKTAIPTKLPNPNALTIDGVKYDGTVAVNIETQSGGNILYGKKWVACGDSFTAGGYNASDGFAESVYIYQDGRFAGRQKVYPNIIGLRNNMDIVNLATGGQTMANSSNSFMTRYTNIDADADYITIMLGINDKVQDLPVGTLEDTTAATFCGAYNIALAHIIENHPLAHIGIIVSNGTNEEIMEATRNIAEWWGLPYLDFGSPQVPLFNRYTGKNVNPEVVKIREKNFCVISDGTTPTNAHPNTAAHEYESTFIEAWLRTL